MKFMKSTVIGLLIILFFLVFCFVGCTEIDTNVPQNESEINTTDDFELIDYTIETFDTGIPWESDDETSLGSGFVHNESADYYRIQGMIKNNLNQNKTVQITIDFYNTQQQYLDSYTFSLANIAPDNFRSFSIRINSHNYDTFSEFNSITFQFQSISS
jgi:hypothetical protein